MLELQLGHEYKIKLKRVLATENPFGGRDKM
jgi:hypothetical protein